MLTRADRRRRALDRLNEDPDSPVFHAAATVNADLDEAAEVLAEEAHLVTRSVLLATKPGWTFYPVTALGGDVLAVRRVWHVARGERLACTTMAELDRRHETWLATPGDPECWFPLGLDTFGVYPRGAAVLRVDYLAWPAAAQADRDPGELTPAEDPALVTYAEYLGLMRRWETKRGLDAFARFLREAGLAPGRHGTGRGAHPVGREVAFDDGGAG